MQDVQSLVGPIAPKPAPKRRTAGEGPVGVLVVHGIGSPRPAEAIIELVDALKIGGCIDGRKDVVDARRLSGPDQHQTHSELKARLLRGGPMPVIDAEGFPKPDRTNRQLYFAEVFWADITQLPGGIVGVLRGYYDVFFNLRTLITSAVPFPLEKDPDIAEELPAEPAGESPSITQGLCSANSQWHLKARALFDGRCSPFTQLTGILASLTCKLIAGPIACANLLLFLYLLWTWLLAPFVGLSKDFAEFPPHLAPAVTAFSIGSLVTIGWFAWRKVESLVQPGRLGSNPKVLKWFALSCFILALAALTEWLAVHAGILMRENVNGITKASSVGYNVPWLVPHRLIDLLGGLVLPLLLIFFVVQFVGRLVFQRSSHNPSVHVALLAPMLQAALWMVAIPEAWRLLGAIYPFPRLYALIPCEMARQEVAAPLLGFVWAGLGAFTMLAFIVAAGLFWLWRSNSTEPPPRLIVAAPLALTICVLVVIGALHGLYNSATAMELVSPHDYLKFFNEWLGHFEILRMSPAILAFMVSFGSNSIRQALSLADEVFTYLEFNGAEARRNELGIALRAANHAKDPEGAIDQEMNAIERRRPIRHCFSHALQHLLEDINVSSLIIVSHSQGTVIALDEILEANSECEDGFCNASRERVPVSWVTMGSPIHHLYQHYFPSCYPPFSANAVDGRPAHRASVPVRPYWARLVKRVDRWINIYRPDDFVGTHMGLGQACRELTWTEGTGGATCYTTEFQECPIHAGGHNHYWSDEVVVRHLGDLLDEHGFVRKTQEQHSDSVTKKGVHPVS